MQNNDGITIETRLNALSVKASQNNAEFNYTLEIIKKAKSFTRLKCATKEDYFMAVSSLNLLNAAVKVIKSKDLLTYKEIKIPLNRLMDKLANTDFKGLDIEFYINPAENCAYIELYTFQFSFHYTNLFAETMAFLNSGSNRIKPWKGVRLQKVADELFELAFDIYRAKHPDPNQID